MCTHKTEVGEHFLEMTQGAAGQEGFFTKEMNMGIAPVSLQPQDVFDFEKVQSVCRWHRDLERLNLRLANILDQVIKQRGLFPAFAFTFQVALHGGFELIRIDGLKQIIQRREADGLNGVVVKGCSEDDVKSRLLQFLQKIKPVFMRHFHIKEYNVGCELLQDGVGFICAAGLPEFPDFRDKVGDVVMKHIACFYFVVYDECFNHEAVVK